MTYQTTVIFGGSSKWEVVYEGKSRAEAEAAYRSHAVSGNVRGVRMYECAGVGSMMVKEVY